MNEKKFKSAFELGGLPAPGIGISREMTGAEEYGGISHALEKETTGRK